MGQLLLVNMLVAVVVSWLGSIMALEDPVWATDELRQRLNHPVIKAAVSKANRSNTPSPTLSSHATLPCRRVFCLR